MFIEKFAYVILPFLRKWYFWQPINLFNLTKISIFFQILDEVSFSTPCLSEHQNITFKLSIIKIVYIILYCPLKEYLLYFFVPVFCFVGWNFLYGLDQTFLVLSLKFNGIKTSDRCSLMLFFQFLTAFLFLARNIFQSFDHFFV